MLERFKGNWLSTITATLAAALGAFATTENLDKLTAGQAALAFGGCLLLALNGLFSADAKAPEAK